MALTFYRDTHTYELDGVRLPSVTQIIPKPHFFISPEQLETARQEGVDNHSMIKMFFDTGDAGGDPMLCALADWLDENRGLTGDLIEYEKPRASIKLRFAGTPDAIFTKSIIDFKRSLGNPHYHALQIAGYIMLAVEAGVIPQNKTWLILWYDGEKFKARNVYFKNADVIFKRLIQRYYIEQEISAWMNSN